MSLWPLLLAPAALAAEPAPGSSPAMAGDAAAVLVLGSSNEAVSRPSTLADLALSFGGAFQDGTFPTSYAVEVAPFWLSSQAGRLSVRDYAAAGAPSLVRNANLSFAATRETGAGTQTALALRTTWWPAPGSSSQAGRFVQQYDRVYRDNQPVQVSAEDHPCVQTLGRLSDFAADLGAEASKRARNGLLTEVVAAQVALQGACAGVSAEFEPDEAKLCEERDLPTRSESGVAGKAGRIAALIKVMDEASGEAQTGVDAAIKAILSEMAANGETLDQALKAHFEKSGQKAFEGCADLLGSRQGFVLDVAIGAALGSPDESLLGLRPQTLTAWLTPGWLWLRSSLFGILRISHEGISETPTILGTAGLGAGHRWEWFALNLGVAGQIPLEGGPMELRLSPAVDLRLGKGIWFSTGLRASLPGDQTGSFVSFGQLKLGTATERSLALPGSDELAALSGE